MAQDPKIRYDEWTEFHNPTTKDFVGKWDGEEYLVPHGTKQIFPVWLARHFAKRLCDEEMIKRYKIPLKPEAEERTEFIKKCLTVDLSDIDTSPNKRKISMKDQIEADRAAREQAEAEAEDQGEVLQPTEAAEIPVGDDEVEGEEPPAEPPVEPPADDTNPPKTEAELQREVAQENLEASQGKVRVGANPTGKQEGAEEVGPAEFEGNVADIQMPKGMQPPGFNVG